MPTLQPGSLFAGRYRVVQLAGEGAGGSVYQVEDATSPGSPLALKVLDARPSHGRRALDRARREFLLLAHHAHPHLARVHDLVGEPRTGRVALVYEWLPGPDLSLAVLRPLVAAAPADRREELLLDLLRQALSALAYLHLQGIVHGDVSLRNFRFEGAVDSAPAAARADGLPSVRLLDFGLARLSARRSSAATPRRDLRDLAGSLRTLVTDLSAPAAPDRVFPRLARLLAGLDAPTPAGRLASAQCALEALDRSAGPHRAAEAGGRRRPVPFVGRARELLQAVRWLRLGRTAPDTAATTPGIVTGTGMDIGPARTPLLLVVGESGSGRTAFLEQVGRRAVAEGFTLLPVHAPRAWESCATTLAALLEARHERVLAAAVKRLAGGGRGASVFDPRAPATRALLFDGIVRVARDTPLLVLCDDLDRAPAAEAELFLHLAGAPARVLGAAAAPPGFAPATRHATLRIELPPLAADEIRRLVAGWLGPVAARLVAWVADRSAGSAALVVETARWLEERVAADGRLPVSAADLGALDREVPPAGLTDWHLRRFRALPPRRQDALVLVCLAGWPLDAADLAALMAATPCEVDAILGSLEHGAWIRPSGAGFAPGGPALAHALASALSGPERVGLHRRLLARLEDRRDAPADGLPLTVLRTRHALETGARPRLVADGGAAVAALCAGRRWEDAADLAARLLAAAPSGSRRLRLELLDRKMRAERAAGRADAALATSRQLLRRLDRVADGRAYGRALAFRADLQVATGQLVRAIPAYRGALAALGPRGGPERAELFDRLAFALCEVARTDEAEAAVREGLTCAAVDDHRRRGSLLNTRGYIAQRMGLYAGAQESYRASLAERRRAGDVGGEADTQHNLAMTRLACGAAAAARTAFVAARRAYAGLSDWVSVGQCGQEIARAYLVQGNVGAARRALQDGRRVHARCGYRGDDYLMDQAAGYLELLAGNAAAARQALEGALAGAEAAADPVALAETQVTVAQLCLAEGLPAGAQAALERARANAAGACNRDAQATVTLVRASYALSVNRVEDAAELATQALDDLGKLHLQQLVAEGMLLLGQVERRRANATRSRTLLRSAARLAARGGARWLELLCLAEDPAAFGGERALLRAQGEARRLALAGVEARLLLAGARCARTARAGLALVQGATRLAAGLGRGELRIEAELEWGKLALKLDDTAAAVAHFREVVTMIGEVARNTPEADRDVYLASPALAAARDQLRRIEQLLASGGRSGDPRAAARARGLDRVLEITAELNSTRSTRDLLGRIMDAVFEMTRAERGFLVLADGPDRLRFAVTRNPEGGEVANPGDRISRTVCRRVMETGRALVAADARRDEKLREIVSVREERLTSVLCIPFRIKERILGVFYVDNRHQVGAFRAEDVSALEVFAHQAALALENVRLAEEKDHALRRAEELARRLERERPRTPSARTPGPPPAQEVRSRMGSLLGWSAAMQEVYEAIQRVAAGYQPILLLGETGTGKELIAREIHRLGPRARGRFVPVNCGALSAGLEESELFGHVRGAFTGAASDRKGLVESAHGGTLFLDEVATMPAALQAKLLRVLQDGVVRRVGADSDHRVDLRVLAASNEDLLACVRSGRFREDLYYRLRGEEIRVPPLRERRQDVEVLAEQFLQDAAVRSGRPRRSFCPEALELLRAYAWPGNVRELEQSVHALAGRASGAISEDEAAEFLRFRPAGGAAPSDALNLATAYQELQQRNVAEALRRTGGSRVQAARLLGVSTQWLYEMMKKFGLQ